MHADRIEHEAHLAQLYRIRGFVANSTASTTWMYARTVLANPMYMGQPNAYALVVHKCVDMH